MDIDINNNYFLNPDKNLSKLTSLNPRLRRKLLPAKNCRFHNNAVIKKPTNSPRPILNPVIPPPKRIKVKPLEEKYSLDDLIYINFLTDALGEEA